MLAVAQFNSGTESEGIRGFEVNEIEVLSGSITGTEICRFLGYHMIEWIIPKEEVCFMFA